MNTNIDDDGIFQGILEEAGYETRSYSGRGMYGDRCLGVDPGPSLGHFLSDVLETLKGNDEATELAIEAFRSMKQDSMDLGIIVYFEHVPYRDESLPAIATPAAGSDR